MRNVQTVLDREKERERACSRLSSQKLIINTLIVTPTPPDTGFFGGGVAYINIELERRANLVRRLK